LIDTGQNTSMVSIRRRGVGRVNGIPLSYADLAMLRYGQARGITMNIGFLAELAGSPPELRRIHEHVAAQLDRVPEISLRLIGHGTQMRLTPGPPPDLVEHIRERRVAPNTSLDQCVSELLDAPLPLDAPLWAAWLIHGYAPDRHAVIYLAHHSFQDAYAILNTIHTLFGDPTAPPDDGPAVTNSVQPQAPRPTTRRTPSRALAGILLDLVRALLPRHRWPLLTLRRTGRKVFSSVTIPLSLLERIGQVAGGTVNDVYLAALAGTMRELTPGWWRTRSSRRFTALIPMAARRADDPSVGSRAVMLPLELPCAQASPARRLELLVQASRPRKSAGRRKATRWLYNALPRWTGRWFIDIGVTPWYSQLIATAVRLGQRQFVVFGARPERITPITMLTHRHPCAVALITYGDQATVGFIADAAVPEAQALAELWLAQVHELANAVLDEHEMQMGSNER
jgi:diacylglycerol O-acyltransferase / wax synthase